MIAGKYIAKVVTWIGSVHWAPKNLLTDDEQNHIRTLLAENYYIMLSRRNNHLSTYAISLVNLFLEGRFGYWAHAFMNTENTVTSDGDFRILEAIGSGVKYDPFSEVFNVNAVVLLKPRSMPVEDWTRVLDKAKSELGKPYDSLFDLKSDSALSCVELVRTALMAEPDYATNFADFERLIQKHGNLSPQMFYDCKDFEVVYEVRR